jgi:dihydroxyacetone kinase-like predicted kinase
MGGGRGIDFQIQNISKKHREIPGRKGNTERLPEKERKDATRGKGIDSCVRASATRRHKLTARAVECQGENSQPEIVSWLCFFLCILFSQVIIFIRGSLIILLYALLKE